MRSDTMESNKKEEGKMLADIRKTRGLSQAELGELIGETEDWIYNR